VSAARLSARLAAADCSQRYRRRQTTPTDDSKQNIRQTSNNNQYVGVAYFQAGMYNSHITWHTGRWSVTASLPMGQTNWQTDGRHTITLHYTFCKMWSTTTTWVPVSLLLSLFVVKCRLIKLFFISWWWCKNTDAKRTSEVNGRQWSEAFVQRPVLLSTVLHFDVALSQPLYYTHHMTSRHVTPQSNND